MAVKFSQFITGATLADIDYFVGYKGTNNVQIPKALLTGIDGSGTANYIPKFIDSDTLGDSIIYEDVSDNVGIGNTSPLVKTHISTTLSSGSIQDALLLSQNTATSASGQGVKMFLSSNNSITRAAAIEAIAGSSNDHSLAFYTNGAFANPTERMRIDSSGNVGIGATSINSKVQIEQPQQISGAFSNPFIKLSNSAQTDNTGTTAIALATSTADNYGYAISAKRGTSGNDSDFIITHHNNSLTGTPRLVIDSSGNVGIGTSSPSVSLDVSSTDAIKVPDGTTAERPGSPAAGMFRYNSDTAAFEGYTTTWGAIGGGGVTITKDQFTGDNTTVAFTLSVTPSSADNINIYISGVYQNSLDSAGVANYSVSGTTLTFVTAPPVTATNGIEVVITE